ncbi:hypothetical protein BH11BAC5_BH11BAC5_10190 [soil metagenome]
MYATNETTVACKWLEGAFYFPVKNPLSVNQSAMGWGQVVIDFSVELFLVLKALLPVANKCFATFACGGNVLIQVKFCQYLLSFGDVKVALSLYNFIITGGDAFY